MKVKEESEKVGFKAQHSENEDHGIWSHHFMGNRWGNCRNSVRLYFGGSKTTADGDCSHEIKRHLLLERKVMTNPDSILKSRDITLTTKVSLVKAMVFPVVIGVKLKLQYFGQLMRRVDSLGKTLMLGGIWGRRRRG